MLTFMLAIIINSIIRSKNPTLEQFEDLIGEIESRNLFPGVPRRFIGQREKVGRFTIERTKSIISGSTIYDIYEHEHTPQEEYDLSNTRRGYEVQVSKGKVTKIYQKNNPVFFNGDLELLTTQKRYYPQQ